MLMRAEAKMNLCGGRKLILQRVKVYSVLTLFSIKIPDLTINDMHSGQVLHRDAKDNGVSVYHSVCFYCPVQKRGLPQFYSAGLHYYCKDGKEREMRVIFNSPK